MYRSPSAPRTACAAALDIVQSTCGVVAPAIGGAMLQARDASRARRARMVATHARAPCASRSHEGANQRHVHTQAKPDECARVRPSIARVHTLQKSDQLRTIGLQPSSLGICLSLWHDTVFACAIACARVRIRVHERVCAAEAGRQTVHDGRGRCESVPAAARRRRAAGRAGRRLLREARARQRRGGGGRRADEEKRRVSSRVGLTNYESFSLQGLRRCNLRCVVVLAPVCRLAACVI
eukprot:5447204-Pleurochrysis_carterae.AAC.3